MERRRLGEVALVTATVLAAAGVVTTWTTSGRRDRNGLATLEALDRLDLLDPPWDAVLVIVTASVPLFLAVAAAGLGLGRSVVAATGAAAAAVVLGTWAGVVLRSSVGAAPGPQLTVVASFALGVTVWCALRAQRRDN